jgi:hypothetical protein
MDLGTNPGKELWMMLTLVALKMNIPGQGRKEKKDCLMRTDSRWRPLIFTGAELVTFSILT